MSVSYFFTDGNNLWLNVDVVDCAYLIIMLGSFGSINEFTFEINVNPPIYSRPFWFLFFFSLYFFLLLLLWRVYSSLLFQCCMLFLSFYVISALLLCCFCFFLFILSFFPLRQCSTTFSRFKLCMLVIRNIVCIYRANEERNRKIEKKNSCRYMHTRRNTVSEGVKRYEEREWEWEPKSS